LCRSVTRSYYRNSVGGLLVFDLTNRASFDHVVDWHAEVCERVQPHRVMFLLLGHKSDRGANNDGDVKRVISREEAEKFAGRLGMPYMEASAKTGDNVHETFEALTQRIYKGLLNGEVELRDGWDGVKCTTPQGVSVQRDAAQPQTADGTKGARKKCCG